jgi:hypothetical protein
MGQKEINNLKITGDDKMDFIVNQIGDQKVSILIDGEYEYFTMKDDIDFILFCFW